MIPKSKIKKIAERVVWSMNMKEDETLVIKGGAHEQELVEEIALIAMAKGIHPTFATASDYFYKEVYRRVPLKYLRKTSKLGLKMVDAMDNYITIERPKDPRIFENIPHERFAATAEGGRPISKKMDRLHVKWCVVGYPTYELAKKLGIGFPLLKRFIIDGILIDIKSLMKKAWFLANNLKRAEYVQINDEFGTNLRLRIFKRSINVDDGFISDEDIKNKRVGLNLPTGEVFLAPIETFGDGVLICPKRTDIYTTKMIENITLVFEDGKLNLNKTSAEKNESVLKETIRKSIKIDKKYEKRLRTTNVAELGIGLNPVINDIIGYLLCDEKIGGTIHVAIGQNKMYGGTSESALHWDFISNKKINLEAIFPNGKGKVLIENGKCLIE